MSQESKDVFAHERDKDDAAHSHAGETSKQDFKLGDNKDAHKHPVPATELPQKPMDSHLTGKAHRGE
jgi:hypothetical protein